MEYLKIGNRVYSYPDKPRGPSSALWKLQIRSVSQRYPAMEHLESCIWGCRRVLGPRGNYVLFGDL